MIIPGMEFCLLFSKLMQGAGRQEGRKEYDRLVVDRQSETDRLEDRQGVDGQTGDR